MYDLFRRMSEATSTWVGKPVAFSFALLGIAVWALLGPFFDFSNTWQLIVNTGTTIITFLMVFLIQNTQNRDSRGLHLKLDELIVASSDAKTQLVDLSGLSDEQLDRLEQHYQKLAQTFGRLSDEAEQA